MEHRLASYTGCLLGLAAGDALGYSGGVLRLENGYLPTTAYTQLAAYCCNGLLLGLTRGQLSGTMAPPVRYIHMALQEWASVQAWRAPSRGPLRCWVSRSRRLDYRRCTEPGMLDVLLNDAMATMEEPAGSLGGPGALMAAAAVGLFFDPGRLPRREIQRLGAEAAALSHGAASAFLSGAAMAHMVSRMAWDGEQDLRRLSRQTAAMLKKRFGREYSQAVDVAALLRMAAVGSEDTLARLEGVGAERALAAAVYCCLYEPDPEKALTLAASHSHGAAAAAGAILGARTGNALSGELAQLLECTQVLEELAEDMFRGCPMMQGSRVFDIEWDEKYAGGDL